MNVSRLFVIVASLVVSTTALAQKTATPSRVPPRIYNEVYALCIGINEFPGFVLEPGRNTTLDSPQNSAERLAELLRKRYGYTPRTLLGSQATKAAIEQAITEYRSLLGPDDALLIFLATHGASIARDDYGFEGFLVPCNARLTREDGHKAWEQQAVSMHWLGQQCREMNARHVLVVVEACCSGFMGTMGSEPAIHRSHEILAAQKSRAAITGGTREQRLLDGIFGSSLCEVLSGLDRAATARELHLLVRDKVMARIGEKMQPQYREMLLDQGEFVFIPTKVASEDLARQLQQSTATVAKLMGDSVTLPELFATFEASDYRYATDAPTQERQWKARVDRFKHYAESAGSPLAMAALYYCHHRGLGTAKDDQAAYSFAQEAFDSGHAAGKHVLAECYKNGFGVAANKIISNKLLREAADDGFAPSALHLAHGLFSNAQRSNNRFTREEREQLLAWLQIGIKSDLAMAKLMWGQTLGTGLGGIPMDLEAGVRLIRDAAKQGLPDAIYVVATFYVTGVPGIIEPSLKNFRETLIQAANAGHAESQFRVGGMYLNGDYGFPKEASEAIRWLQIAAQHHGGAALQLAWIYHDGKGTAVNVKEAAKYLDMAAETGEEIALFEKGKWIQEGIYYERNPEKALSYFERAGRSGYADGWFMAGQYYESLSNSASDTYNRVTNETLAVRRYVQGARLGSKSAKKVLARQDPMMVRLANEYLNTEAKTQELIEAGNIAHESDPRLSEARAKQFNELAWRIVARPGETPEAYASALRLAEEAHELAKNDLNALNTLGVAQYRVGRYETALETLRQSQNERQVSIPEDVAFIAMSLHRLGKHEEAQQELEKLRQITREPQYSKNKNARLFLREAIDLLKS